MLYESLLNARSCNVNYSGRIRGRGSLGSMHIDLIPTVNHLKGTRRLFQFMARTLATAPAMNSHTVPKPEAPPELVVP